MHLEIQNIFPYRSNTENKECILFYQLCMILSHVKLLNMEISIACIFNKRKNRKDLWILFSATIFILIIPKKLSHRIIAHKIFP